MPTSRSPTIRFASNWCAPARRTSCCFSRASARLSRFDIALGHGATADDLDRVGKALDEVFRSDPFEIVGLEASPDGEPISSLIEAWGRDGWSGVARAWERRAMVLASLRYTVGVIVLVALALLLSLALLWGSRPPRSASDR